MSRRRLYQSFRLRGAKGDRTLFEGELLNGESGRAVIWRDLAIPTGSIGARSRWECRIEVQATGFGR